MTQWHSRCFWLNFNYPPYVSYQRGLKIHPEANIFILFFLRKNYCFELEFSQFVPQISRISYFLSGERFFAPNKNISRIKFWIYFTDRIKIHLKIGISKFFRVRLKKNICVNYFARPRFFLWIFFSKFKNLVKMMEIESCWFRKLCWLSPQTIQIYYSEHFLWLCYV